MRKFWFGKYKGQYIIDVCKSNYDYITWCILNVKGFSLNTEERAEYELSATRHLYDDDDEFNREMTYDMMNDFD